MRHCQREYGVDVDCQVESRTLASSPANGRNRGSGRHDGDEKPGSSVRPWLAVALLVMLFPPFPGAIFAEDGTLHLIKYRAEQIISGEMRLPSDVALDGSGRIFILNGTADEVRVYSPEGHLLSTLGGPGVLDQPLGLDVSAAGQVVVADSGNHRLALFPAGGATPHFLEVPAPPDGKPSDPTDVHFGPDNTFIVVDNDNHRVVALNGSGKTVWAQGTMGRNPNEFRFPFLMDMDRQGNSYVVETINTRIQVLDKQGNYSNFIGEWGIEPGQFFRPKGVAVNEKNEVFASDSYLGVIQVFKRTGELIGVLGDEKGKVAKFTTPVGMAVSGNRLYVVEMFNNRVVILEKLSE